MTGTVVDYSKDTDSVHYIKILSGEKLFTFYTKEQPDVHIGAEVEFNPKTEDWRLS